MGALASCRGSFLKLAKKDFLWIKEIRVYTCYSGFETLGVFGFFRLESGFRFQSKVSDCRGQSSKLGLGARKVLLTRSGQRLQGTGPTSDNI